MRIYFPQINPQKKLTSLQDLVKISVFKLLSNRWVHNDLTNDCAYLSKHDFLPSSIFSFAKDCPLRTAIERNVIEFNLEPPRYLVELVVPLLAAPAALVFVLAPASPASLLLLRGPESENNLPEIWRREKRPWIWFRIQYIQRRARDTFCYKFFITIFTLRNFPSSTNFLRGACMIEFTVDLELSVPSEFRLDPFCCVFLHKGGGAIADNCKF